MKKQLLLAVLALLLGRSATAQTVFAPTGAEWWYRITTVGGPGYLYAYADSLMPRGGRMVQRVQLRGYWPAPFTSGPYYPDPFVTPVYVYAQNDAVYYLDSGQPRLLVDFNWTTGISRPLRAPGCFSALPQGMLQADSTGRQWIDSATTITRNGVAQRQMFARGVSDSVASPWSHTFSQYGGSIVERLGYVNAPFIPAPDCTFEPYGYYFGVLH